MSLPLANVPFNIQQGNDASCGPAAYSGLSSWKPGSDITRLMCELSDMRRQSARVLLLVLVAESTGLFSGMAWTAAQRLG
jgi:hypothetical protein